MSLKRFLVPFLLTASGAAALTASAGELQFRAMPASVCVCTSGCSSSAYSAGDVANSSTTASMKLVCPFEVRGNDLPAFAATYVTASLIDGNGSSGQDITFADCIKYDDSAGGQCDSAVRTSSRFTGRLSMDVPVWNQLAYQVGWPYISVTLPKKPSSGSASRVIGFEVESEGN